MKNKIYDDKVVVCLSRFVYSLLQKDMAEFHFFQKNGKANENAFLNRLLPNMILFRNFKNEELRKYLNRNIKAYLPIETQEGVLQFLTDSFDFSYFDDASEFQNDVRLNWRIKKRELGVVNRIIL